MFYKNAMQLAEHASGSIQMDALGEKFTPWGKEQLARLINDFATRRVAEAYAAGQEVMREAAAKLTDHPMVEMFGDAEEHAAAIRALPIMPLPTENPTDEQA